MNKVTHMNSPVDFSRTVLGLNGALSRYLPNLSKIEINMYNLMLVLNLKIRPSLHLSFMLV